MFSQFGIPVELALEIFSHLAPENLLPISRVCREFKGLMNDKRIWLSQLKNLNISQQVLSDMFWQKVNTLQIKACCLTLRRVNTRMAFNKLTLIDLVLCCGNTDLIEDFFSQRSLNFNKEILDRAAKICGVFVLKFLMEIKQIKADQNTLNNAAGFNTQMAVDYISRQSSIVLNNYALNFALRSGNERVAKFLIEVKKIKPDELTSNYALASGHVPTTTYLLQKGYLKLGVGILNSLARNGYLLSIKHFIDKENLQPNVTTLNNAIEMEHLECIKYLADEKGIKPDNSTQAYLEKCTKQNIKEYFSTRLLSLLSRMP